MKLLEQYRQDIANVPDAVWLNYGIRGSTEARQRLYRQLFARHPHDIALRHAGQVVAILNREMQKVLEAK